MSDSERKRKKKARDLRWRAKHKPKNISVFHDDSDEIRTIGKEKHLTDKKVISLLLATYRFLHTKKIVCVDQATQTMPDVYSCCHCGSSPLAKPMPPLARPQPSGPQQLPCQESSPSKCINEKDNGDNYTYDDGNVTLDNEKELDPDKKLSKATDHLVAFVVKEEVLSDLEQSNSLHSDQEESFFDPRQGLEFGSDIKLEHSETGWYGLEEEEKEEEEEEEEDEEEEEEDDDDETEDDEEIDYEALERLDPTYDPLGSRPQHLQSKNSKVKPGSSKVKSSKCLGDQESFESDDSLEYGGESVEDFKGKPAHKRKRHQSKNHKPAFKFPEACPICFEAWKEKREVMHHLQKHVPIDKGPEAIKDAVQSIKSKFEKERNFGMGWCGECKKLFWRLRAHLNRSHNINSTQCKYRVLCQQCGKMIKSSYIKDHEISHLEIKESDYVQCPQCPSRVKHQIYLKSHIRYAHSDKTRSVQCSTYGKILRNRSFLERHLAIHSGVRPYSCSLCDKSFTQRSNLKAHMRQHTGDKPYVCELCEMAFNHNVSLRNHKKKLHGIDWWKERESWKMEIQRK